MIVHIVQSGDTLYVLSKRYSVSIQEIIDANNLANPNVLVVGQKLTIPVQAAMPTLKRGNRGTAVIELQEKLIRQIRSVCRWISFCLQWDGSFTWRI